MNNDDQAVKKAELVMSALTYAHDHNLDIKNEEHVRTILKEIDLEHYINDVSEFMTLLQSSQKMIEKDVVRRKKLN
ncbi:hypothetical protein HGA88_03985 [Candidatus Roizmanbacteria bacterium]|nr:hypothetical protein [Candidatus Roizmanbacteria bacterium]